jgi:hypothetical protein
VAVALSCEREPSVAAKKPGSVVAIFSRAMRM